MIFFYLLSFLPFGLFSLILNNDIFVVVVEIQQNIKTFQWFEVRQGGSTLAPRDWAQPLGTRVKVAVAQLSPLFPRAPPAR